MHKSFVILLVLQVAGPVTVCSQTPSTAASDTARVPIARAARRKGNITLDGKLDEAAWQAAPVIDVFTQSYPQQGAKPTDRTEARVLYDDAALYVGIRMFDSHPDSIVAQLARRDASGIYSDWIHLIIDSYHDRRTAFRFTTNPRGVKKDVYTSNDFNEDTNWDAVWEVGTRVDSLGWVAEYRIPLSQLRYGDAAVGQDRVWGFQIMRDIARRNERDSFSPWTPQSSGFVSRFGDLAGLIDLPSPRRLEVLPYASTRLTRAPVEAANPFSHANQLKLNGGADVRYGLPAGLTLTATLHPDFGQVEVDPSVVNLTAFETFFPEKRPFFLEGSDVLTFGQINTYNDYGFVNYFYSRRIGREPQLSASGPGVLFADQPEQATIAGAAKITGKAGPWTIGLLEALTPEARARILTTSGTSNSPVEPLSNYFAGRVKRDFRDGATVIGAMLTSATRDLSDPVFKPVLRSSGTFGGIDFEHDMQQKNWVLTGFLAGTRVDGSRSAIAETQLNSTHYYQRPDASYLNFDQTRNSLTGYTDEIALSKAGTWYGSLAYKEISPGLELNDIGFIGRADLRALSTYFGYQDFQQGKRFRQFGYGAFTNHTWNFGGTSIFQEVAAQAFATLNNFWQVSSTLAGFPADFSDRFTRGGPIAANPASVSLTVNVGTDTRKPISLSFNPTFATSRSGGTNNSFSLGVDTRPSSNIHVVLGPNYSLSNGTGQYVRSVSDALASATYGKRYVFANLHQSTLALDTRVEWTFTTTASLQVYAQPFVSAGRYFGYKEFLAPGKYEFGVYGVDKGTISRSPDGIFTVDPDGAGPAQSFQFADPTFNIRNLRGNAVLRWEYRPGSALFVVWQQQRSGFEPIGDFNASRDVGAIFRTVPTNIFLIKASYWIGR